MDLRLRPTMWVGGASQDKGEPVQFEVIGLAQGVGEFTLISWDRYGWHVLEKRRGARRRWPGVYVSADAAVAAIAMRDVTQRRQRLESHP